MAHSRKRKRAARKLTYRSGLEDRIGEQLKKEGVGFKYEHTTYDVVTDLGKNSAYCVECGSNDLKQKRRYTPDFFLDNGIVIETKGILTADNRRLIKAFIEQHPDVDYRMLFSKNNKLSANSKTRYSEWCEKLGIPWAIKEVPPEWLKR